MMRSSLPRRTAREKRKCSRVEGSNGRSPGVRVLSTTHLRVGKSADKRAVVNFNVILIQSLIGSLASSRMKILRTTNGALNKQINITAECSRASA